MTEELALQDSLSTGGTGYGHKICGGTRAVAMQSSSHWLLAGAALPQQEHGGIRGCHLLDLVVYPLHGGLEPTISSIPPLSA